MTNTETQAREAPPSNKRGVLQAVRGTMVVMLAASSIFLASTYLSTPLRVMFGNASTIAIGVFVTSALALVVSIVIWPRFTRHQQNSQSDDKTKQNRQALILACWAVLFLIGPAAWGVQKHTQYSQAFESCGGRVSSLHSDGSVHVFFRARASITPDCLWYVDSIRNARISLTFTERTLQELPVLTSFLQLSPKLVTKLWLSGTNIEAEHLQSLPDMPDLTHLDLSYCDKLTGLGGFPEAPVLTNLNLRSCDTLNTLEGMPELPALTVLDLSFCEALTNVAGMPSLPRLTSLDLHYCRLLDSLKDMPDLPSLESLNISSCYELTTLEGMSDLPEVTTLDLSHCLNLSSLKGMSQLPNLASLTLLEAASLTDLHGMPVLRELDFPTNSGRSFKSVSCS